MLSAKAGSTRHIHPLVSSSNTEEWKKPHLCVPGTHRTAIKPDITAALEYNAVSSDHLGTTIHAYIKSEVALYQHVLVDFFVVRMSQYGVGHISSK